MLPLITESCSSILVHLRITHGAGEFPVRTNKLLSLKSSYFEIENNVYQDQLASKKPADQDMHCFPFFCKLLNDAA